MAFKSADDILRPDPRFESFCVLEDAGPRRMTLADHHRMIREVSLAGAAPLEVRDAFDRARNTLLYAFFDYDLMVVAGNQAFGAFELALKHRLNGHGGPAKGTLRNLVDRARKQQIFPPLPQRNPSLAWRPPVDPIEAMIALRNDLAHGTSQVHSPGIAMDLLSTCAWAIDLVFPPA